MKPLLFLTVLGTWSAGCLNASGQEDSPHRDVPHRLRVGDAMPFHVVEFVAGARSSHRGCPSVMIGNARARGVEIWAKSADAVAFQLAGMVEHKLPDATTSSGYLVVFDATTSETLRTQANQHRLKKFHVAVPQESTGRLYRAVAADSDDDLLVFLLDGKEIKHMWAFANDEASDAQLQEVACKVHRFLARQP